MEIFKDFGIQPILLLAQILNFVILLFLLKRFLYKPILKILEERKERIETSLKQADEIQKKFNETATRNEEILNQAKNQASKVIEEAKEEAKELQLQIQKETKQSVEETLKRAQSNLELERRKMVEGAKQEIVDLVLLTNEKIITKVLKGTEKEKLVKNTLKELQE